MELTSQTSFIPKRPVNSSSPKSVSGVNIITLISVIIFLASVTLAIAMFLYQTYLSSSLTGMQQSFAKNEKAFDPTTVSNLTALSQRLTVADGLLKQHIAPSGLFTVLEASTLKSVRFTNFSYTFVSPQKITLTMQGQAKDYNSIAKQSDVFSETPANQYLHNVILSNLNLDPATGNVVFSFSADVDPNAILYTNQTVAASSTTN